MLNKQSDWIDNVDLKFVYIYYLFRGFVLTLNGEAQRICQWRVRRNCKVKQW